MRWIYIHTCRPVVVPLSGVHFGSGSQFRTAKPLVTTSSHFSAHRTSQFSVVPALKWDRNASTSLRVRPAGRDDGERSRLKRSGIATASAAMMGARGSGVSLSHRLTHKCRRSSVPSRVLRSRVKMTRLHTICRRLECRLVNKASEYASKPARQADQQAVLQCGGLYRR